MSIPSRTIQVDAEAFMALSPDDLAEWQASLQRPAIEFGVGGVGILNRDYSRRVNLTTPDDLTRVILSNAVPAPKPQVTAFAVPAAGDPLRALDIEPPADGGAAQPLDAEIVKEIYDARIRYADRAGWQLAPELMLLELSTQRPGGTLATELLKSRAGLLDHQIDAEVARTDLVRETKVLMQQLAEDRKAWRKLAKWAPPLLISTIVISTAAIAYVLLKLANNSGFDAWTIPVIIFALALFAASPAVLLLTEKPLKGIDEWTPAGITKSGEAGDNAADSKTPAPAADPAPSGAAGYTKGPGRPD
jgi:hypothetical protein